MLNWKPESIAAYRDVQTLYHYHHRNLHKTEQQRLQIEWRSSRDNARTPMQWDASPNAGFTQGTTTWMDVNENYRWLNVAQQEQDPDSILQFYRKAIQLRKQLPVVRHGSYREYFPLSGRLYCYSREMAQQRLLVFCSFSPQTQKLRVPHGFDLRQAELVLHNYEKREQDVLQPYETRVYLWR